MNHERIRNLHDGWLAAIMLTTVIATPVSALSLGAPAECAVCSACGTELAEEDFFRQECGRPTTREESIFCWRCGVRLPAAAEFCSRCGSSVCRNADKHQVPLPVPLAAVESPEPMKAAEPAWQATRPGVITDTLAYVEPEVETDLLANLGSAAEANLPAPALAEPLQTTFEQQHPIAHPEPAADRPARFLARSDAVSFPPRLFDLPTGTTMASLDIHASRGWTFGFSDQKDANRWGVLGKPLSAHRALYTSRNPNRTRWEVFVCA